MKYILLTGLLAIASCSSTGKLTAGNGKVIVQREDANGETVNVTCTMFDAQNSHTLILSDVWIGEERFGGDSSGTVRLSLKPGRYQMEARSFGFENYKYALSVKRGKKTGLLFYLVPYKNNAPLPPFH